MPVLSTARSFSQQLRAAGYDAAAVSAAARPGQDIDDAALARVACRTTLEERGDGPLARLLRLFALGVPGPLPAGSDPGALAALGLVRPGDDGAVVPLVRIGELEDLYVCADLDITRPDVVAPVSHSTLLTAAFTPLARVRAALDVGTGSGVHALRLARVAERVVATDVSERALEFTRLNAELNGLTNIETRLGSFLEPVAGEHFGLVVCNAPYVISPDTGFLYRDGGMRGDALSLRLLDDLPTVLEDGGFATLQGNWVHPADGPWYPAPPCGALMARIRTFTPREYALAWSAAHHRGDPEGYAETVARWLAEYRALGIEAITTAMVVLRGGWYGRPWATTVKRRPEGLGPRLPGLFKAADQLAHTDPLSARLRLVPGVVVERRRRAGEPERCALEHPATPCVRRGISPALADAVEALPGPADFMVWDEMTALVKLGFVELEP